VCHPNIKTTTCVQDSEAPAPHEAAATRMTSVSPGAVTTRR